MQERKIKGPIRVTFPSGNFVTPGMREFHTVQEITTEQWEGETLIDSSVEKINEVHFFDMPDPGLAEDNSEPLRRNFSFHDKTVTIVREDDLQFWGEDDDGNPRTKAQWFEDLKRRNAFDIKEGAERGWWDIDANGDPQKLAEKVSIEEMTAQGKPLMAHLMVDLGFFPSVSQARKNGWDKPLELGRHELGPRKKRAFVEIIP
jgi:hypothetical protein